MSEEIVFPLFDDSGAAITGGAASTGLKARRGVDGFLLDWDDLTFKNTGWTTLSTTYAEVDATNLAGYYKKSNIDITAWNDGWYQFASSYTVVPKRNAVTEVLIKGGKVVEVRTADNLDAAISSRASQTSLDKEVAKLFALIEFQRGNHTGEGKMFHVDPVNGSDANDGLTKETSKLTWNGVNALVVAHRHDIVLIHTANNGAPTVWSTSINMNKAFTFVRSVGRDLAIVAPDSANDTVTIAAVGCELSGCIVKTHTTGNKDAIKVTADFYQLKKVWIDYSRGHGLAVENASHGLVDGLVVQDAAAGSSGHAISIKSTSGNSKRNFLKNIKLLNNVGDGIRFDGANTSNNFVVAGDGGSAIDSNTGYGVNELNGADHNHIVGPGLLIHKNTAGDINLTGANSVALNVEQLATLAVIGTPHNDTLVEDVFDVLTVADQINTKSTTIQNRIGAFTGTGLNNVLGFFRAIGRKDAALTPSDMGGTFDNTTDSLEANQAEHDVTQGLLAGSGSGANQVTIQVEITGGAVPIPDVQVQVFNSDQSLVITKGITNVSGQKVFALDNGTYKVRLYKAGYSFTVPETIVVSGNGTFILDGVVVEIGVPLSANTCRVYEWCFGPDDSTPLATVTAEAKIVALPYDYNTKLHAGSVITKVYDANTGKLYWDIVYGASVQFTINELGVDDTKTIPALTSKRLTEIA